ncbi:MAG: guanylate kinase [Candidatus Atribacteria bacterium]|jgi:guanylate kinase|nr:MAG: guanylate kinase [Candidatus Atribacteria bacterium]
MWNNPIEARMGIGKGLAFVVTGPSGAGKNSVIDLVMAKLPGLVYSVSYTSRPRRPSEVDHEDYVFVSQEDFLHKIEEDDFLEHVTYLDDHYGTSRSQIEDFMSRGLDVVLNVEVEGAKILQQKDLGAIKVVYVFLTPSSMQELEARLRRRNTEDEAKIRRRLEVATREMESLPSFDYLVINDDLDTAVCELASIIVAERIRLT